MQVFPGQHKLLQRQFCRSWKSFVLILRVINHTFMKEELRTQGMLCQTVPKLAVWDSKQSRVRFSQKAQGKDLNHVLSKLTFRVVLLQKHSPRFLFLARTLATIFYVSVPEQERCTCVLPTRTVAQFYTSWTTVILFPKSEADQYSVHRITTTTSSLSVSVSMVPLSFVQHLPRSDQAAFDPDFFIFFLKIKIIKK